jgi:hypothetical protein
MLRRFRVEPARHLHRGTVLIGINNKTRSHHRSMKQQNVNVTANCAVVDHSELTASVKAAGS